MMDLMKMVKLLTPEQIRIVQHFEGEEMDWRIQEFVEQNLREKKYRKDKRGRNRKVKSKL